MELNALFGETGERNMVAEFTAVKVARAVQTLRDRVAVDKIAKDVFHVMSIRERARNVITLGGLQQRMKKEGYNYEVGDYADVLKLMASLDFGTLMTDSKGRTIGLKDIKITLQSIGSAAIGQSDDLVGWKPRNKYVPIDTAAPEDIAPAPRARPSEIETKAYSISITALIHGTPVNIPIPNELTEKEIASLIVRLRGA